MARASAATSGCDASARASARSGARAPTRHDDSARIARLRCGVRRRMESKHGGGSPRRPPAPPWGLAATRSPSAGTGLASRAGPLRGAERDAPPAVFAPTRAPSATAPTSGSPSGASRPAAPQRTRSTGRARRRKPHRTPPPLCSPNTDRTARPKTSRSFTERLDGGGDWRHSVHRQARCYASATRARVFHHPGLHLLQRTIYVVTGPGGTDDVRRSSGGGLRQISAIAGQQRHLERV